MKHSAVCLYSGGLDSILAVEIIKKQDITVHPIWINNCFEHIFIETFKSGVAIEDVPDAVAQELSGSSGYEVEAYSIARECFQILTSPRHGFGKNMNPCIDCKTAMLKKAKAVMYEKEADFIVTGSVAGQRPMSQNKNAFVMEEKDAGVEGILLRPLSAKLLKETVPEKIGMVNRQELYGFSGRRRTPQIELAETFGIASYPQPAGGCMLTDRVFSERLKNYMAHGTELSCTLPALICTGRHFRLSDNGVFICGRNEEENNFLERFKQSHLFLRPESLEQPGPSGIFLGSLQNKNELEACSDIITRYMKFDPPVRVLAEYPEGTFEEITSTGYDEDQINLLRI